MALDKLVREIEASKLTPEQAEQLCINIEQVFAYRKQLLLAPIVVGGGGVKLFVYNAFEGYNLELCDLMLKFAKLLTDSIRKAIPAFGGLNQVEINTLVTGIIDREKLKCDISVFKRAGEYVGFGQVELDGTPEEKREVIGNTSTLNEVRTIANNLYDMVYLEANPQRLATYNLEMLLEKIKPASITSTLKRDPLHNAMFLGVRPVQYIACERTQLTAAVSKVPGLYEYIQTMYYVVAGIKNEGRRKDANRFLTEAVNEEIKVRLGYKDVNDALWELAKVDSREVPFDLDDLVRGIRDAFRGKMNAATLKAELMNFEEKLKERFNDLATAFKIPKSPIKDDL